MRRRARRLSRTREVQLRELGMLVVEMRRLGRDNPELVARKAAEVGAIDDELRGLRGGLGGGLAVEQVVAAGVSGSCPRCRTLLATEDRFCPHCGRATAETPAPASPEPLSADGAGRSAADPAAAAPPPPPPPPPPPAPEPSGIAPPSA